MDEEKLREIYLSSLASDEPDNKFLVARAMASDFILSELAKKYSLTEAQLETASDFGRVIGRLGYFRKFYDQSFTANPPLAYKNLELLIEAWEKSIRYLHENYDSITSEELRRLNPRDSFIKTLNMIEGLRQNTVVKFKETGQLIIPAPIYFRFMDISITAAVYTILGYDPFMEYEDRLKKAVIYMQKLPTIIPISGNDTIN